MILQSLDGVVTGLLFKKRLPMHYYLEFLFHASDCVRETGFDIWSDIKVLKPTLNSVNAFAVPEDFVKVMSFGSVEGQRFTPWLEDNTLVRHRLTDTDGNLVKPSSDDYNKDSYLYLPERGEIQVNTANTDPTNLVLYYATDQSQANVGTVIHPHLIDLVEKSIWYGHICGKIRKTGFDVQHAQQEMRDAIMIVRGRRNILSKELIYDILDRKANRK